MKSTSRLHGLSPAAAQSIVATAQALEAGRPDDASRALAGVLASHPDHPEALRLEAGIFNLRGQHVQAANAMRRALAQRPDDALYHNTLGSVLADAGEFDAAIAAQSGDLSVPVTLTYTDDAMSVQVGDAPADSDARGTLWLVLYDRAHTVEIARGENTGRTITYHNVVREMRRIGILSRRSTSSSVISRMKNSR